MLKTIGTSIGIGVTGTEFTGQVSTELETEDITIELNDSDSDLRGEEEHCAVSEDILDTLNRNEGEQLRVGCDNCADYHSGLYTISKRIDISNTVEMSRDAMDRMGFSDGDEGWAKRIGPHPDIDSIEEADNNDEYCEILEDDGEEDRLVATAVHGGWMEYPTHKQSEYVADELDVTEWTCPGFSSGGGAFDRWHITSTDVHPDSFPELGKIADRGFEHCVSFHGFSEDGIAVGGDADKADREEMRDTINAYVGDDYDVYLADPDGPYAANSPENFCNWLTKDDNGIQLEVEWDARQDDWDTISEAAVDFYDVRI